MSKTTRNRQRAADRKIGQARIRDMAEAKRRKLRGFAPASMGDMLAEVQKRGRCAVR